MGSRGERPAVPRPVGTSRRACRPGDGTHAGEQAWYPTVLASSYYVGERFEQAAAVAEEVLEHQPENIEALLVLAASQSELGLERRARATGDLVRHRFPRANIDEWLATNPYQDERFVERWRRDLEGAGLGTN